MHVAQGHRHEAGGDASAGDLDGTGVGAGDAGLGLDLVRQTLGLGRRHEALEHSRVDVGAARDNGTLAADDLSVLRLVDAGIVGGVRHVERDGHIGV